MQSRWGHETSWSSSTLKRLSLKQRIIATHATLFTVFDRYKTTSARTFHVKFMAIFWQRIFQVDRSGGCFLITTTKANRRDAGRSRSVDSAAMNAQPAADIECPAAPQQSSVCFEHAAVSSADIERHCAASRCTASRLLWSRLTEIEQMRNDLLKLDELICAVVEIHHNLSLRIDDQMRMTLDYATRASVGRQRVDEPFGVVLNELLQELEQ
jgi:hypothetical protein